MEPKDLEKEVLGSVAGYAVTVCLFLVVIYVLDIIKGELFYSLLIGFIGGVGLTGWLWGREKNKWLEEKDELEGRLAQLAEQVEELDQTPENRAETAADRPGAAWEETDWEEDRKKDDKRTDTTL